MLGGVLAGVCCVVPSSLLEHAGSLLRRSQDVTPERVVRFRTWVGGMGAAFLFLAWIARARRSDVERFFEQLGTWVQRTRQLPRPSIDVGLLAVALTATLFRAWMLDTFVDYDEAYSYLNFARRPLIEAISDYNNTNNHVFNTLLMHGCHRIWGQRIWALRLPAFVAGVSLIVAMFFWLRPRLGRPAALVSCSLAAASPLLIFYSTNARGYMWVALFAVLFDASVERMTAQDGRWTVAWLVALIAGILGLWSMPIMLYPMTGTLLWSAAETFRASSRESADPERSRAGAGSIAVRRATLLFGVALGTAALYGPAFVFRGFMAFDHPFVTPLDLQSWLNGFPRAWWEALRSWSAGPWPAVVWLGLAGVGIASLVRRPALLSRFAGPVISTALLMSAQRVAPPPRLFAFLASWYFAVVAAGIMSAVGGRRGWPWMIGIVLLGGGIYEARHPVLYDAPRQFSLEHVVDAVERIAAQERPKQGEERLRAISPWDLPALYHLNRLGLAIPLNGTEQNAAVLWVLLPVEGGETGAQPDELKLLNRAREGRPGKKIAAWPGLELWRLEPKNEYNEPRSTAR